MHSLRQEHARLSQLLTLLSRECSELEREPQAVVPVLREALQYVVQHTNVHHHPREEVLFEQLARRSPQHRELRDALEREHEAAVRVGLSKLRALEQLDESPGTRRGGTRLAGSTPSIDSRATCATTS